MKWTVCQRCKHELKPHERAEGFCDGCLKAHTPAYSPTTEPDEIRGGDLERLEFPKLSDKPGRVG